MAQLRKYEVNKMKYFYGVVHCNNKKTAAKIYKDYQGFEFELTNIRLNLSFIDDALTFPQKIKEEADEVPPGYSFNSSKVSRALNHSTVKLSWDQNDPKRQAKLANNYKAIMKKNLNQDDYADMSEEERAYKDLIAPASDDESDVSDDGRDDSDNSEKRNQNQERIDKMRQKLLSGLSNETQAKSHRKAKDSDDEQEEELEVNFGIGFGGDIGKSLLEKKEAKKQKNQMNDF